MTNNYVIYDANGLLQSSELHPISKGNNNVDRIYVAFTEYDYNNTYITVAVTLPDGNSLPELTTTLSDFTFKNVNYKGYYFTVLEPLTAESGVLTLTFNLKSKKDDSRLCTSRLNVTIYDSDVTTEPNITKAQLENLITTIDNTGKDLENKKLDKDFSLYSRAETVIGNELIAIYDAEAKYNRIIDVKDTYNITAVNGVEPINKQITLTASELPYNDKSTAVVIAETINEMSNKANINDVVGHRDGVIIEEEIQTTPYKGLLPYIALNEEPTVAVITQNGYKFQNGDLLNFDVEFSSINAKGTITINKVINETSGRVQKYRVPIYTNGGDEAQETNMYVGYCIYTIAITENNIKITGLTLKSMNTTSVPEVTLQNISILRA